MTEVAFASDAPGAVQALFQAERKASIEV